jgi:hypothetical protein
MKAVRRFRTHCPSCGPVSIDPSRLELVLDGGAGTTAYRFPCDGCRSHITAEADPPTAELLFELGVTFAVVESNAPAGGGERTTGAKPTSY